MEDWERRKTAIAFRLLVQEVSPAIFFRFCAESDHRYGYMKRLLD